MKRVLLLPLLAFPILLFSQIAVTEFISDPNSLDDENEWVELYNYSLNAVDIEDWTIEDEDSDNSTIISTSFNIPSGDFVILAVDKAQFEANWLGGNANSMVLEVSMILANTSDEIIIKDQNGNTIWNLAYGNDEVGGRATFFTEDNFSVTNYGSKSNPGVDRVGNDVTGSLGYQRNSTTTDPDSYTAINGDLGSPLLGGYTPLPISLTSFTAKPNDKNSVALNWVTASEENNDYFSVEHSIDGRGFIEIDQVHGAGTTSEYQFYSFVHENARKGNNYYRLRQVDYDGTFSFSQIEVVVLEDESELVVRPTLATTEVQIFFNEELDNNGVVEIVNFMGQVIESIQFSDESGQITLDVNDLDSGHYVIRVNTENGMSSTRFIKL